MGLGYFLPFGKKKHFVRAIIVYPNKRVVMKKVEGDKPTFAVSDGEIKRSYAIDQKAVYFFEKEPLLFYNSGGSSPIIFSDTGLKPVMSSAEFTSILESKAVNDLLEASKGQQWDWHFIASMVSAVGVILLFLQGGGLGFLGIGG